MNNKQRLTPISIMLSMVLLLLTACSTTAPTTTTADQEPAATAVPEPATSTPVPPTDTPSAIVIAMTEQAEATPKPTIEATPLPTSCEEVEGPCLEMIFTGQRCVYRGPEVTESGPVTLLLNNTSRQDVYFLTYQLLSDKTIADVTGRITDEATLKMPMIPRSWGNMSHHLLPDRTAGVYTKNVYGGQSYVFTCAQNEPYTNDWYGGGFVVEE